MGSRPEPNRIVWITIVAVIAALAIGGVIGSSSSSSSTITRGTRAVVVPTADTARTVMVPPCGTGAAVTSPDAKAVASTPGTASVELPRGGGLRVVLIPKCTAGHGGSTGTTSLPSALFVPRQGSPLPTIGTARSSSSSGSSSAAAPQSAQFELTVPNGSPIRTIIVSPCEKAKGSTPAEQILATAGRSSTAVAPPC